MNQVVTLFLIIISVNQLNANRPGLYNSTKHHITILTNENYNQTLFNKSSTCFYLVEFYAHWCGGCRHYAPTWIDLASRIKHWNNVVKIAALNCADPLNGPVCKLFKIEFYPTIRLFPLRVNSTPPLYGTKEIEVHDPNDIIKELLKEVELYSERPSHWPNLNQFESLNLNDFLENRTNGFLILEKVGSLDGRHVIMDLSGYDISIRTTSSPSLMKKFGLTETSLPVVLAVERIAENITFKILNQKDFVKVNFTGLDNRMKMYEMIKANLNLEMIRSKDESNNSSMKSEDMNKQSYAFKMNMHDLETGLNVILRHEIPSSDRIDGDMFLALKGWVKILAKYFPGRKEVRNYLQNLEKKLNNLESNEITGSEFKEMTEKEQTSDSFLLDNTEWVHCQGSKPEYRGFPCSLWTLFHTLTVSQIENENSKPKPFDVDFNVKEVFESIQSFVKHFFRCSVCSKNFQNETNDYLEHLKQPHDAVIYLWTVHNRVNKRLANDITADPVYPKIQFPSKDQCQKCYNEKNEWIESEVFTFLSNFYSSKQMLPATGTPVNITSTTKKLVIFEKLQKLVVKSDTNPNNELLQPETDSNKTDSILSLYLVFLLISLIGVGFIFFSIGARGRFILRRFFK